MSNKTRRAEAGYQWAIAHDPEKPEKRKDAVLSVRISPQDRDAIARLATAAGISQGDLIVRKVLGVTEDVLERRIARLEARAQRLERRSYGVALSDLEFDALEGE
jgi:uncharacterized protein (DUF1778 family)